MAEHCQRLAVGLAPGDDWGRKCLADVLLEQKKYAEAEPIYRELLLHASEPSDKFSLNYDLAEIAEATGRKQEADNFRKEYEKAMKEVR
jgi:predicted Zn-dependent protease